MARRRTYRKRSTRRRSTRRRTYRRRSSSRRRSSASRRRGSKPCPPGFHRTNSGQCGANRKRIAAYVGPKASTQAFSKKSGQAIKLKTRYANLAEAMKARQGWKAPFSLTIGADRKVREGGRRRRRSTRRRTRRRSSSRRRSSRRRH